MSDVRGRVGSVVENGMIFGGSPVARIQRVDVSVEAAGRLCCCGCWWDIHEMIIRGASSEPLLLAFAGFVVLEPVEHILPFYLPILPETSRDPLDLISRRWPNSIVIVELFQDSYLITGGCPSCAGLPAQKAGGFHVVVVVAILIMDIVLLSFHDWIFLWLVSLRETKWWLATERERERDWLVEECGEDRRVYKEGINAHGVGEELKQVRLRGAEKDIIRISGREGLLRLTHTFFFFLSFFARTWC